MQKCCSVFILSLIPFRRLRSDDNANILFIMSDDHSANAINCYNSYLAGTVIRDLVENTDFAPLFIDYAGGTTPEYMQGRSFRHVCQGRTPQDWKKATYYRYYMHMSHFAIPAHYGIRTKRYKLIY